MRHLINKSVVFKGHEPIVDSLLVLDIDETFYYTWMEIVDDMIKYHKDMKAQYDISYARRLDLIRLHPPKTKDEFAARRLKESMSVEMSLGLKPYQDPHGYYVMPTFTWKNMLTELNNKHLKEGYYPFQIETAAVWILGRKNALSETDIFICWGNNNVRINPLFEMDGMETINRAFMGINNPLEQIK